MAYRHGQRRQGILFPASIEDYVSVEAPVRVYDAIIDALDMVSLGFEIDPHKVGSPKYNPLSMLKLLVYGYSYGVRSSRKLERECNNNISFIWLMGDLKPDHKTIAEFRRKNKKALSKVLRFDARNFTYDGENDCYICPKGNVLPFKNIERKKRRVLRVNILEHALRIVFMAERSRGF